MASPDSDTIWYVVVPFPDRQTAEQARDRIGEETGYVMSIQADALPGGGKIEPPSDGPAALPHERCNCRKAAKWGATGVMPPGHHWHWLDTQHTAGYLAHGDLNPKAVTQ